MCCDEHPSDLVPVIEQQGAAHCDRGVAYSLKDLKDLRVPVDVLLGDLPIVGSRVTRLARVTHDHPAFEFCDVGRESLTAHPLRPKVDRSYTAVSSGIVILVPCRNLYDLTLDVCG